MQTIRELHRRYHKQLGITFSTMYPGCIAETSLFRQKRGWFRTLFPLFMRYVSPLRRVSVELEGSACSWRVSLWVAFFEDIVAGTAWLASPLSCEGGVLLQC